MTGRYAEMLRLAASSPEYHAAKMAHELMVRVTRANPGHPVRVLAQSLEPFVIAKLEESLRRLLEGSEQLTLLEVSEFALAIGLVPKLVFEEAPAEAPSTEGHDGG